MDPYIPRPPCTVEPESSTYLVECLNNGGEAGGKEMAQKQGVPTIYSLMQIGPQAPEEGPWLSLIAVLQGHGGGRVGPHTGFCRGQILGAS